MKKIISIILITVLLLQSTGSLLVLAGYEINKEYISKYLCINKSKPLKKCNGKCHLNKELKNEQEREKNPVSSKMDKREIVQYFVDHSNLNLSPVNTSNDLIFFYPDRISQGYTGSVFHPPSA